MKYEPGQRVIFQKRGDSRHYDTDWPATYIKLQPSGRHHIRVDGWKRTSTVRDANLRPTESEGIVMGDPNRGIYHKFNVTRTDGASAPGGKHDSCFYFVLDCDHDKHAKAALQAYADSCRAEFPLLAADLDANVAQRAFGK